MLATEHEKSKAVLVVSFGTSHEDAKIKNIDIIEKAVAELGYKVYTAFTSEVIRKIWAKRNVYINSVGTALGKMEKDGVTDVVILPTHLLYGEEYNKILDIIKDFAFNSLSVAKPLLASDEDIKLVLKAVYSGIEKNEDEAIILMGHGSDDTSNKVYEKANLIAKEIALKNLFVCTLKSKPSFQDSVNWAKENAYKKAILAPLMLVAGEHVSKDMYSDNKESLKSKFLEIGVSTKPIMKGLTEYNGIVNLYISHLEEKM